MIAIDDYRVKISGVTSAQYTPAPQGLLQHHGASAIVPNHTHTTNHPPQTTTKPSQGDGGCIGNGDASARGDWRV
ncbi:hypothetical protein GCM10009000_109710 [Halobacterium noricense]